MYYPSNYVTMDRYGQASVATCWMAETRDQFIRRYVNEKINGMGVEYKSISTFLEDAKFIWDESVKVIK